MTSESEGPHWREEDPEGLLYLTKFDTVPLMIDALFDAPPNREFTKKELAERADISKRSVNSRLGVLRELGIIKDIEDSKRFTLDLDGEITWSLRELDGAIRKAQGGKPPKRNREPETKDENPDRLIDRANAFPREDVESVDNAEPLNSDDGLKRGPDLEFNANAD